MKRLNRGAAISLLVLVTAGASGCAMIGARDGGGGTEPDPDLIARNLIHVLAQLPELHPMQTTLQVSTPSTPFGERVLARLEDAGYGIQEVTADQGEHYVRYRAERAETETGERTRYRIAVGEVALERDYRVVEGETVPGSAMSVRGAGSRDVALDDGLPLLVLSFHSPSLVPGNTPYVHDDADLDALYDWWRAIYAYLDRRGVQPTTVREIMQCVEVEPHPLA